MTLYNYDDYKQLNYTTEKNQPIGVYLLPKSIHESDFIYTTQADIFLTLRTLAKKYPAMSLRNALAVLVNQQTLNLFDNQNITQKPQLYHQNNKVKMIKTEINTLIYEFGNLPIISLFIATDYYDFSTNNSNKWTHLILDILNITGLQVRYGHTTYLLNFKISFKRHDNQIYMTVSHLDYPDYAYTQIVKMSKRYANQHGIMRSVTTYVRYTAYDKLNNYLNHIQSNPTKYFERLGESTLALNLSVNPLPTLISLIINTRKIHYEKSTILAGYMLSRKNDPNPNNSHEFKVTLEKLKKIKYPTSDINRNVEKILNDWFEAKKQANGHHKFNHKKSHYPLPLALIPFIKDEFNHWPQLADFIIEVACTHT